MTVYTVVLYAHLLGAVALFIGQGIEWTASSLFRGASSTEQVRASADGAGGSGIGRRSARGIDESIPAWNGS